jgi:prevent-host-death family protein
MYTIREAKASFARLIEKAIQGEEVIITRRGKPVVKIVTVSAQQAKRVPGRWKGKISYAPDAFDPMSKEELAEWGIE